MGSLSKPFRLLIFDCDGVLVDSEPYSCAAWNVVMEEMFNVDIGTNYDPVLGKSDASNCAYFSTLYPAVETYLKENEQERLDIISQKKLEAYYRLARGKLKKFDGLDQVLSQAKSLSWPVVVGSSGTHEKIRWSLTQVALESSFDEITSTTDVKRGKPFPDLFQECARKQNIPSEESIVIEDSINGLIAGRDAGSFCIAITTTYPRDRLEPYADLVIDSFTELDLSKLSWGRV